MCALVELSFPLVLGELGLVETGSSWWRGSTRGRVSSWQSSYQFIHQRNFIFHTSAKEDIGPGWLSAEEGCDENEGVGRSKQDPGEDEASRCSNLFQGVNIMFCSSLHTMSTIIFIRTKFLSKDDGDYRC